MSIYLNQEFPPRMSSKIILDNIITSSAPASFTDQITLEVTFTVLEPLAHPLNWKITYVGSAQSEDYDQTLEEFQIGPIENCGTMKFDIGCKNPDPEKIPRKELLCVTALIITASYLNQEFIRVGYYVHNQLVEQGEQSNLDEIPLNELTAKIKRIIISDKPRVTKFKIKWDKKQSKNQFGEESQSKLSDFFSVSQKSQQEDHDSTSQKIENREENEKLSTQQENNQIMITE